MIKWIKKNWSDPVWSKVFAGLITSFLLLILSGIWILIQLLYNKISLLESILAFLRFMNTRVNVPLWIFILAFIVIIVFIAYRHLKNKNVSSKQVNSGLLKSNNAENKEVTIDVKENNQVINKLKALENKEETINVNENNQLINDLKSCLKNIKDTNVIEFTFKAFNKKYKIENYLLDWKIYINNEKFQELVEISKFILQSFPKITDYHDLKKIIENIK